MSDPTFSRYEPDIMNEHFIGREAEMKFLLDAARSEHRNVLITGEGGTGKTALAMMFRQMAEGTQILEVKYFNSYKIDDKIDHLEAELRRTPNLPRVVIIDEVDALAKDCQDRLDFLIHQYPDTRFFFIGRHLDSRYKGFERLSLKGLSQAELAQLVQQRLVGSHADLSQFEIDEMLNFTSGHPLTARLVLEALISHQFGSWKEIAARLRSFETPGLFGPDGQPLRKGQVGFQRIITDVASTNDEILHLLQNDPELVWKLPPRKFEEIVAELLTKQGYDIELTPASGDGGFDMYAAKIDGLGRFLYLVECKRYQPPNKVGVEVVRSLHGVVRQAQATAGAIVSTSYFTRGAQEFQSELRHQMHLHDFLVLRRWISGFSSSDT